MAFFSGHLAYFFLQNASKYGSLQSVPKIFCLELHVQTAKIDGW